MSAKRVLLFVDNAKRDLLATRLLEVALQKRGFYTKLCSSQNGRLRLRQFQPHAFISSRGDHLIAREAAKCCRVYVVPSEGNRQTKESMLSVFMGRGYWKLETTEWISKCYLWNENTYHWLLETNMFRADQLMVVGNCRFDVYRGTMFQRRCKNDFVLGVAFSAKDTSACHGRPHYAQVYFDFHRDLNFPVTTQGGNYEDIVWCDHAILRRMMRYLRRYLEEGSGRILFRPGPFEDPREYMFLEKRYPNKVRVLDNQPLPEFLSRIDTLLTCWSSTGLEALVANIPIVAIIGTIDSAHLFSHMSSKTCGYETFVPLFHLPKTEDELFKILRLAQEKNLPISPKPPSEVSTMLEVLYNWPSKYAACDVIADDLVKELAVVDKVTNDDWSKTFPMPYRIPISIAPIAYAIKAFVRNLETGAYGASRDFYKTSDLLIDEVIKKFVSSAP